METKMDGVKIIVKKDNSEPAASGQEISPRQPKKRPAKKKAPARPAPAANTAARKTKGSWISILASITATAVIAGGGIYAWQNKSTQDDISRISEDARRTRIEFEQRLANLKDKLSGAESENEELKTINEDLQQQTELLAGAKKEYSNFDLGLSFEYPAVFGEVELSMEAGETGQKFRGQFTKNDKLVFGGISRDYKALATTTAIDFLDTAGFNLNRNKYYFQTVENGEVTNFELEPVSIIDVGSDKALLLDKNSITVNRDKDQQVVDLGENLGALLNLKNQNLSGVAFLNMDFGIMPPEEFAGFISKIIIE